jgi:hypothetical protein
MLLPPYFLFITLDAQRLGTSRFFSTTVTAGDDLSNRFYCALDKGQKANQVAGHGEKGLARKGFFAPLGLIPV